MSTISTIRLGPAPRPDSLDAEERMSRDELENLQLTRLKQTLHYAYEKVPLYRQKFDDAGVHPDDLVALDDLAKFPYTTKEDLRVTYPYGMFAVPMNQVARIHASSGTTGRATVVGYTKGDLDTWASLIARSLRAGGVRPGHLVQNSYGYGLFTGGLGLHGGAEKLGCTVIPMSGGQTPRQVQLIVDLKPDAIFCTPSYLLTVADEMVSQGIDPRSTSLKFAVLGAEPWTAQMRNELEERLDVDATDIYGLSEVMGPGVANECVESKDGPHIWEDHFRPEIIDPDTDQVRVDGEHGELVFTSLTKQALPVIRYRTHDLAALHPGTARPGMRRMERISGRTDDMIILRGVNLFPTQIEELALQIPQLSPHFVLELTRPARLDVLTVRIEAREGLDAVAADLAVLELSTTIKRHVGATVRVELAPIGSLDRSTGKLKRVYDNR